MEISQCLKRTLKPIIWWGFRGTKVYITWRSPSFPGNTHFLGCHWTEHRFLNSSWHSWGTPLLQFPYCSVMRVSNRMIMCMSRETSLGRECITLTTDRSKGTDIHWRGNEETAAQEGVCFRESFWVLGMPLSHLRRDFPTVKWVTEPD